VIPNPNTNATGASRNSDPADPQFERQVLRLYTLGARAVCELPPYPDLRVVEHEP
jgi:hypothetical protein